MKATKWFIALAVLLSLVVLADSALAQKRTGTAAATQLLIPVGGRGVALNGSATATATGVEAIYYNPAGLGRLHNSAEGMFSSMSYLADIGVNYGGVAGKFGEFGVLGFSLTSLSFGDIPLTTTDDPENDGGRFYSPSFVTIALSYGRSLTDAISAGLSAKIISEQVDRVSATGFALDIGVQYHNLVGVNGLALGVAVKNIGPQMSYDGSGLYRLSTISGNPNRPERWLKSTPASFELPSLVEIGLSYAGNVENTIEYNVNSTFSNNNLYLDEYKLGGEVGFTLESITLFARAGMQFVPETPENYDSIFGSTFGAGLHWNAPGVDITIDYAYRAVEFFDANNVFSVKFGF